MTEGATKVHISNLGDLPQHECTLQETVTDLRIEFRGMSAEMTNLAASIQELNARIEEFMKGQDEKLSLLKGFCSKADTIATMQAKIELQENRITTLENRIAGAERHHCIQEENIANILKILEVLKEAEAKRAGSKPWEDRLWNIGQAVSVAIVVAIALWFLKGGSIT